MFEWFADLRRKKILEIPFPGQWRGFLIEGVAHYSLLNDQERKKLEDLIQVFVAEKNFEGCGELEMTEQIKVVISAQACLLILELPHNLYNKVDSVLVYPDTIMSAPQDQGVFTRGPMLMESVPIIGQAHLRGPVILVWNAVKRQAVHPERGHNVVYHEFAHKLDMLDGSADGTPPLRGKEQYEQWAKICYDEFEILSKRSDKGKKTFLDPYGATNEAEFFAVATEYFFDKPIKMYETHRPLYDVMSGYYNQDTAARQRRV